jgi:hypothetical protein
MLTALMFLTSSSSSRKAYLGNDESAKPFESFTAAGCVIAVGIRLVDCVHSAVSMCVCSWWNRVIDCTGEGAVAVVTPGVSQCVLSLLL